MKIKTTYIILAGLMTAFVVATIVAYVAFSAALQRVEAAHVSRYDSYLLADELRQSSDDLTRLARTYVVSADPRYEAQYFEILDIRAGKKARPIDYNRIYWDFVAATGEKPRPDGETVELLTLMREAGFTDEEFAKLEEATANSDGLVALEVKAMNAVKGLFADSAGNYTQQGEPDLALARDIMHSREYHQYKAEIVQPIDEFYVLLDQRTSGQVAAAQATAEMLKWALMAAIAMVVVMLAISTWVVLSRILSPIVRLSSVMARLANDEKSIDIPSVERRDEIGDMANSVKVFKDNMVEADRLRGLQAEEQEKQLERGRRMEAMVGDFDRTIKELVESVGASATELQATSQSLSATAEETATQSNAVSQVAQQMMQNVQTVASATEELSSSISEIGGRVTEASRIVGTAVEQAEETNAKVRQLAEAAQKIGEVVTLINDIASQTNLLALNATIEAARAGEAGKGFAVVASEVKNLASQTAKATEEIAGQVKSIQDSTESSADAIRVISQTINHVSEISTTIASAVEEQGAATQEISRNVQQAAAGTSEVTANIVGVTQASQQTSAGSTEVLAASEQLARNGERLRQEVQTFLENVRAV